MRFHGHALPWARALPCASSVGFAVLFRALRLGGSFLTGTIRPGGLRPRAGVLKRMNSAFIGHRLSRKKKGRNRSRSYPPVENRFGDCRKFLRPSRVAVTKTLQEAARRLSRH